MVIMKRLKRFPVAGIAILSTCLPAGRLSHYAHIMLTALPKNSFLCLVKNSDKFTQRNNATPMGLIPDFAIEDSIIDLTH